MEIEVIGGRHEQAGFIMLELPIKAIYKST
jgi:hypothetical protein